MAKEETHPEVNEALHFAESVRLLWQATRQVVYGGIDTEDLAALCSIVARLAEHRILRLESGVSSSECSTAIAQLRDYREAALKLLAWTKTPTPEPDWSAVAAQLASIGAPPLEYQK
jgi:hypothetical protein